MFDPPGGPSAQEELQSMFDGWLADARGAGRLRRDSSEEVYRAMWGAFMAWCLGQAPVVRLGELTREDLRRFLASREGPLHQGREGDLSPRYTWRLLSLIDRVLHFAARHAEKTGQGHAAPNTVAALLIEELPAVRTANLSDRALPDYLPADEARQLVVYLSSLRPRGASTPVARAWHELRNRAAVGLQLGAGLTPGDVRALTLQGVVADNGRVKDLPWKLVVPADGNAPERETPVASWAGQLLRYWLAVRTQLGIPGPWVFPSTGTGKQWAKGPQYRSVGEVLEEAGVAQVKGGSFRLRHTFALRQLRRGKTPNDVARWMGIANVSEMDRYARVLTVPVEVF